MSDERTALAWQRTSLSLVAGAAVLARITWPHLGLGALVPLLVCSVLGGWVLVESRRRYADDHGARGRATPRSGRAPAFLAAATVVMGVTELVRMALA